MTEYRLKWLAAPRAPRHPTPMQGEQTFADFQRVKRFVAGLASDSVVLSLTEVTTTEVDVTDRLKVAA